MPRRLLAALVLAAAAPLFATPPEPPPATPIPDLADGTAAALQHMKSFRVPAGLTVELFAAEPKLASPVALSVDEKGRVFVAEEYRLGKGAAENRGNPKDNFSFWLDDELQLKNLDDRLAMYKRWDKKFPGGMDWFTKWSDQVRLVEDTDGDGKADKSSVFAGGFNGPLDGLAAGVLAKDGDVYLTNIPHLWKLKDGGNGVASKKEALLGGFGVNCAFYGHDLHGLIFGPDGKLYFSVGDRGFHVTSKEGKTHSGLRTGAVFRCDPDGTNFEVVMRGLRNPQELAFDQYGNLFADDNNCDKGDHARLVYVCEDGDSGWHMEYQTINPPYMGGPWFAERLWHLPHAGQPAYLVPPVGKIGTGPSGFLFTSGTTLPDRYKNAFIMCNYAGGRGLESFKVTPKGAGFEIADYHDFLTPIMATDVDQGPDGKLYVSDFVNLDWGGKSLGGRVYTVFDKQKVNTPEALETKKLFAEGFGKQPAAELAKLLGHPNQQVRLRAQWALSDMAVRNPATGAAGQLMTVFTSSSDQLARIHALWAIGNVSRQRGAQPTMMLLGLSDRDPEVAAQAAKVTGDLPNDPNAKATPLLLARLGDGAPRVKFFAAQSLGKLKHRPAVEPLFRVLAENKDADPWLRHACVAALARIGDADAVAAKSTDPNASVRLGVVLVQRKLGDKRISKLLTDADPLVRAEAARAVHDLPIESEFAALAAVLPNLTAGTDDESIARRAISANYRLGGAEHAARVLAAAASPSLSPGVRQEAVLALRDWPNPPPRDRVTGFWNPLPKRDAATVRGVVGPQFEKLLGSASGPLLTDVVGLIGPLGLEVSEPTLSGWVADAGKGVPVRVAALRVLADRRAKALPESVSVALKDAAPLLRAEARDVLAATDPAKGVESLTAVLGSAKAAASEQQRALATLGKLKAPALDAWAEKLTAKAVPAELQLDVIEALKAAPSPARDKARTAFEGALPGGAAYSKFAVSLVGGDADRGREVFVGHAAAQCLRCHVVGGMGGNAGPDLSKVAGQPGKDRAYLMESLLNPSAKIAPGFGAVTLTLVDGRSVSGVLAEETAKSVVLVHPDNRRETIALEDIERRSQPTSAMPAVDRSLTPREVRDLVEYLSTLK